MYTDDQASARLVHADFRRLFPTLADLEIDSVWGGPIDLSPTHLPFIGTLGRGNVHYALGYSGNGVAPTYFMSRLVASRVLGTRSQLDELPFASYSPKQFPLQPLRSMGLILMRRAVARRERYQDRDLEADALTRYATGLPQRLGYFLGLH
jgi:glycine/D-amino acid oxidase-like deaminating enzyme